MHDGDELLGKAKFVAVDIAEDDGQTNAILREQNIKRLPVVMLFEGGKVKDFIGGATTNEAIAEMVAGKRKALATRHDRTRTRCARPCSRTMARRSRPPRPTRSAGSGRAGRRSRCR
jgi:hypothetical protein